MKAAGIASGSLFRRVSSADRVWGESVTERLVWRLCRAAGGELEEIQFLLGHVSV
jgi:hypothetical protein